MINFSKEWYAKVEKLLSLKTMSEMNKNQLLAVKAAYSNIVFEFELRRAKFYSKEYQKYYREFKKAEAMLKVRNEFKKLVIESLF